MKNRLALLILILLLVSCIPTPTPTPSPLPTPTTTSPLPAPAYPVAPVSINGGFEGGWHSATTYWTPSGGPYHTQFIEITPPEAWTAWWHERFLCSGTPDHRQRRPEVRVISRTPDPTRVHRGDQAAMFFTFWGCHRGGLYQQVVVEPGKYYTAQAFAHAWFSNCDTKPHYRLPLPKSCDTKNPILWAQLRLRICIDPLGGTDPSVCSSWREIYGEYGYLEIERVQAISNTMTVILESVASHPLKHDDVYWDDVSLSETYYYRVFLPLYMKGGN